MQKGKDNTSTLKNEKKNLIIAENYDALDAECLSKRKACFIALLDGRNHNNVNYENHISVLHELVERGQDRPFSFLAVNATCHDEILKEFNINIDSLPNAIVYIPIKDMYTSLIGTFDVSSIESFMDRTIRGKISMQTITKNQFKFEDKDCSLIKEEEVIFNEEDDDIMKEMMEEIKKREEEEKRKQDEDSSKKKKKKKKKKSKKSDL